MISYTELDEEWGQVTGKSKQIRDFVKNILIFFSAFL